MRRLGRPLSRTLLVAALLAVPACQGIDPTPGDEPPSPADRERFVRRRVEDAQAFRLQKRLEAAEHQLRLALGMDPDHARAHHLLARTLMEQGRAEEARPHEARAAALSPPRPAGPDAPAVADASGVLVVLVPPDPTAELAAGPGGWPSPRVPRQLAKRLRARLPGARVSETSPAGVVQAEAWLRDEASRAALSLRVDEARCGESAKDGPFAIAALTAVAARTGALPDEPVRVRTDDDMPPFGDACTDAVLDHAVDAVLALPGVAAALAAPKQTASGAWPALAVRALLPLVDVHAARERARAETAAHDSPLDETAVIRHAEAERAAEQTRPGTEAPPADPEAEAFEAELAAERRRRDELLAALRVDELALRAPSAEEVAVLRVVPLKDPGGPGPRLAAARAGGEPIELRVLDDTEGRSLARFYFRPGATEPLLREEDTNHDGVPDRWTAYADGRPREILEDRGASGAVNARRILAPDGVSTERIEIDMDGDGRPERIFHYVSGALAGGDSDTDGDGVLDRFERFDPDGSVSSRDEDLDGDGTQDVHSEFRGGRLVRRELRSAAQLEAVTEPPSAKP